MLLEHGKGSTEIDVNDVILFLERNHWPNQLTAPMGVHLTS